MFSLYSVQVRNLRQKVRLAWCTPSSPPGVPPEGQVLLSLQVLRMHDPNQVIYVVTCDQVPRICSSSIGPKTPRPKAGQARICGWKRARFASQDNAADGFYANYGILEPARVTHGHGDKLKCAYGHCFAGPIVPTACPSSPLRAPPSPPRVPPSPPCSETSPPCDVPITDSVWEDIDFSSLIDQFPELSSESQSTIRNMSPPRSPSPQREPAWQAESELIVPLESDTVNEEPRVEATSHETDAPRNPDIVAHPTAQTSRQVTYELILPTPRRLTQDRIRVVFYLQ